MSTKKATTININNEKVRNARNNKYQFTMIDNELMSRIIADCGGNCFAVYMNLISKLSHKTGVCCPSMETMAQELGMSNKTINTSLKKLKEAGYIDWEQGKAQNNNWKVNYYYFKYPSTLITDDVEVVEDKVATAKLNDQTEVNKAEIEAIKVEPVKKEIKLPNRKPPVKENNEPNVSEYKVKLSNYEKAYNKLKTEDKKMTKSILKTTFSSKLETIEKLIKDCKVKEDDFILNFLLENIAYAVDIIDAFNRIKVTGIENLRDYVYIDGWEGYTKKYA